MKICSFIFRFFLFIISDLAILVVVVVFFLIDAQQVEHFEQNTIKTF